MNLNPCVEAIRNLTLALAASRTKVPDTHRVVIRDREHVSSRRMEGKALNPSVVPVLQKSGDC